jgi:hypothetical protein
MAHRSRPLPLNTRALDAPIRQPHRPPSAIESLPASSTPVLQAPGPSTQSHEFFRGASNVVASGVFSQITGNQYNIAYNHAIIVEAEVCQLIVHQLVRLLIVVHHRSIVGEWYG